jgi:hypothetical protein
MRPWLDRWQLSRAVLVAGFFSLATPRVGLGRLWGALKVWTRLARAVGALAPTALYKRRLVTCHRCPFYSRRWGTCGSPLEKGLHDVGCWCLMLAKARYAESTCWLDDTIDGGNTALRSFAGNGWRASGADAPSRNARPQPCCTFVVTVTPASPGAVRGPEAGPGAPSLAQELARQDTENPSGMEDGPRQPRHL